ncbi:MAG: glutaredoxin-like protein [Flavobacteriales bacterium]
MNSLTEGQVVPNVSFKTREANEWKIIGSDALFANKRVIVFALPGAFTPTCSTSHLPRYNALAPVFKDLGVDSVICLSVNDAFVMNAWKDDQQAENVVFLPDGNGDFSRGMGMLVDKNDLGFGERSWRYSMLVNNGTIEKLFVEEDEPGDPFRVSDADTMLNYLAPSIELAPTISLLTKPGCSHCTRAKAALDSKGLSYEVIELGRSGVSYDSLTAITGQGTTPQVFIGGELIGGADELEAWLSD